MEALNVLVIEDEIVIYMHIIKTLKCLGFKNIYVARNAKDAFDIATKLKIDLVFSDIKIEGEMDGIETSKQLQLLYRVPIIFITAYKDEETLIRASGVDFIGYLLKPYRQDELEALIKIAIVRFELLQTQNNCTIYEQYEYHKKTKELFFCHQNIKLTKKESLFVTLMFSNINTYVSYETLDKIVWYDDFVSENTRRTFIYRIKQKLKNLNLKIEKNSGIGLFTL
jgi:DNA-binding response OmpR family regulator